MNNPSILPAESLWKDNFSMKQISSWRVGGKVRQLFSPRHTDDLIDNLSILFQQPIVWVGYGSNLMVRDGGFQGIAIHSTHLTELQQNENIVYAGAGVGCPKLARYCVRLGFEESAFLSGIPGTIGGALAMNAGCHGSEIWDFVEKINVLTPTGIEQLSPSDFAISYRHVQAKNDSTPYYFIGAWFTFSPGEIELAQQKISHFLKQRSHTQPIGNPTSGSVFCNPTGDYAGRLIEQCGLKNTAVGDAIVSDKHANFIINTGHAKTSDIEDLIQIIQDRVKKITGVLLQLEVKIVGEKL